MRQGLTELVFILDRSGSMSGLESDTIGGYNSLLDRQKSEAGEAIVSTVLFDDMQEVLHDRVNIKDIEPMTREEYYVRGCTALLDAVGGAIHHIGNVHKYARMEPVEEYSSVDHALSKDVLANGTTFIVKNGLAADDLKIVLNGTAISNFKSYTVKEAKGLEFKHVVVIDRDMTVNEKYISYTRALAKLTVIHALPSLSDPNTKRIVEGDEEESA